MIVSLSGEYRMKFKLLVLLIAVAIFAGGQAYAHHSFAATYFENQEIQIEGRLLQFQFRNPHSFVHVAAPDDDGNIQRWAVEWGGTGQLGSQGITSGTLRPGDQVLIVGNPGRNPEAFRVRMQSLRRKSDNFGWGQDPSEVFD
jgi:hypothetical protein